jgi:uncharacterized paraquat-inducible protein A
VKFFRQWAGVIASLILAGSGFLVSFGKEAHYFGLIFGSVGLVAAAWQAWQVKKDMGDPYDLNKLWDSPLPEDIQPEVADFEPDQAYCHRCGHIVPDDFARCPDCGEPVR